MGLPFDPDSPGARRLAARYREHLAARVPTAVVMREPVLDLEEGPLEAGARVVIPAAKAAQLVAAGVAVDAGDDVAAPEV